MVNLGDRIEVVGMGRMFVELVVGATGFGEVVHIGRQGETESAENFTQREAYEALFPEQFAHGIFYHDEGLVEAGVDQPLYVALEDAVVAESN